MYIVPFQVFTFDDLAISPSGETIEVQLLRSQYWQSHHGEPGGRNGEG